MKRQKTTVLAVIVVMLLMGVSAQAQDERRRTRVELDLISVLEAFQARSQEGGLGRGAPQAAGALPGTINVQISGAWWTNAAVVSQLGLTDDQKTRIERSFENHRASIVSATGLLEKEERQLAALLERDPVDRNAVLVQIDRVIQARGEMERTNAAMILEMRESLTRAQWTQLQSLQTPANRPYSLTIQPRGGGGRGGAPATPPATPGARRGPGQQ